MTDILLNAGDNLISRVTGRKKRSKFSVVPSIPATILPSLAVEAATNQEVSNMATITFHPGSGKTEKAAYRLGKQFVPAAVITRIIAEAEGKSEQRKAALVYSKLAKNYSSFIEEMDKADLDYVAALEQMKALKPVKATGGTGERAGKVEKTAEALVKGICKRFKGTPAEMIESFLKVVTGEEFKKEAEDIIRSYQKQFGTGNTGFTKTSGRKGNPKAIKALAAAREAKGKAKK